MRCDVSEFVGKGRPDGTSQQQARYEEQDWAHRPHEDLVRAFRGLIRRGQQEILQEPHIFTEGGLIRTANFTPAIMIRDELGKQASLHMSPDPVDKQRAAFFWQIEKAWDVIAYEHYRWPQSGEPEHAARHHAGDSLSFHYQRAVVLGEQRPEFIKLDPLQAKILDVLAEAADIPHQRGQAAIEIPENLRYYLHHRIGPDGKLIF